MNNEHPSDRRLQSVNLSDREIEHVLTRLDKSSREEEQGDDERFSYRTLSCSVKLQQPGATAATTFLVPTRELSSNSLSFLHGGFVHSGTKCTVHLISTFGSWSEVNGQIVQCRYAEKGVHEVLVQFEREIQPADFCASAMKLLILLVEDDDSTARLASHHLSALNATIDRATNGREAVEMAFSKPYDCVLMDIELPEMNGLEAVKELREKGYSGMIVAATARTKPEDQKEALESGFDRFLPKPFTKISLTGLMEALKQEPLISAYQDDTSMTDLIAEFVESLPAEIGKFEEAYAEKQDESLEEAARFMKGRAGGFGFDPISVAAARLEQLIQESAPREDLKTCLDEVVNLCQLARFAGRSAETEEAA